MPLSPDALPIDARTRLLVVAPHPDDETIGTGELIQHVIAAGGAVRVLLLTSGDDNPWPQRWLERRVWIGDPDRQRWGERRRREMSCALQTLGLGPDALQVLGWPDMGVTDRLQGHYDESLQVLQRQLDSWRPNLIALPALGDRHPDHGGAHVLMRLALARAGKVPPLLSYLVHGRSDTDAAPVMFAPSAAQHATKLAALEAHRSQTALSGARMRRMTDRPERYGLVRSPGRHDGLLPWQPAAAWLPRLRLLLADGERVRSWSWRKAPLERTAEGCYRLLVEPAGSAHASPGPRFAKLSLEISSPWIFDRWGWREL